MNNVEISLTGNMTYRLHQHPKQANVIWFHTESGRPSGAEVKKVLKLTNEECTFINDKNAVCALAQGFLPVLYPIEKEEDCDALELEESEEWYIGFGEMPSDELVYAFGASDESMFLAGYGQPEDFADILLCGEMLHILSMATAFDEGYLASAGCGDMVTPWSFSTSPVTDAAELLDALTGKLALLGQPQSLWAVFVQLDNDTLTARVLSISGSNCPTLKIETQYSLTTCVGVIAGKQLLPQLILFWRD